MAAADLFEQVIERAPNWAPAWFALANAREQLGHREPAIDAYRKALEFDADGSLGADLRLAALGAATPPDSPSNAYVSHLFDQYAPRFEAHLVGTLAYRGPELMLVALEAVGMRRFENALDLGCGTGLAARLFAPQVERFTGVDLAPAMVEAARKSGLYERVEVGEAAAFLQGEPPASSDLVLAADVLVYIGELRPLLEGVVRVLRPGGLFIATAQTAQGPGWELGKDLRYAHSRPYVAGVTAACGLVLEHVEDAWARREHGEGVPGLVLVLSKP